MTEPTSTEAFMERAIGDCAATFATALAAVGDKRGLFAALARGPATSAELASRADASERYVREWLRAMTAAGYLAQDRDSGRYEIPSALLPVLVEEGGPMFLGGVYQQAFAMLPMMEPLAEAFRAGGGVPQDAYGPDLWEGMERFTNAWFENLLLAEWLPALPRVREKLEGAVSVADVGCGAGRAIVKLAGAFPAPRFVGYDRFEGQLERARANAERADLGDRAEFRLADVSGGLPESYDLVTVFDVVHDAVDPTGLLQSIRSALTDDGSCLMLEINSADDPAENVGPLATFLYGASLFYCMTTSLAGGGAGLGTCGLPEARVREMAAEAGFGEVVRAPLESPFHALYELRR